MEIIDKDHLRLSTGKVIYANNLIVGLEINCKVDPIYHGYDGCIDVVPNSFWQGQDPSALNSHECRELAEFMIQQWQNYRDSVR